MANELRPFASLLGAVVDNRGRTCPTTRSGKPLIATNCIKDGALYPVHENVRFVDEDTYGNWFRAHPLPGDILFVTKGTPGRACLVPDPVTFCIAQDMVAVRADERQIYPRYLFAVLRSAEIREQIERLHVGTLIPHFKKGDFDKLLLPVPDRKTQEFIGDIYFLLSAKIELNRRMNETLEAMARALFKSWFVDFDPVRAKAEGRDPGMPKPIADLFPNRFEDSELGEMPAGWTVGRLDDALVLQRGFDLPSSQRTSGPYPVLAASGPAGTHGHFMARGPGVTTGRSGILGKVFFVHDDYWPLNTSLWVKEFRHSTPAYAFHLLQRLDFGSFNAGSAVPTLNRNHVHNLPTLLPPKDLISTFEGVATVMLHRQKHGHDQSLTLATLRDTLLPKLISGELRVRDAERVVAHAV